MVLFDRNQERVDIATLWRHMTSDYSNCPRQIRDNRVFCHVARAPWRRIGHAPHFGRPGCSARSLMSVRILRRRHYRRRCVHRATSRVRFWTWLTIVTTMPLHIARANLRGRNSRSELIVAQLSVRNFRHANVRLR